MTVSGIIIRDSVGNILTVELSDILEEIKDGSSFFWNIFCIEAIGDIGDVTIYGFHQQEYEKEINASKDGFNISWDQLSLLASKFHQIINGLILASKDLSFLKEYETEQEMYNNCDIVIAMCDSSFWKVFSKDGGLISHLAQKFKKTTLIDSTDKKYRLEWPP